MTHAHGLWQGDTKEQMQKEIARMKLKEEFVMLPDGEIQLEQFQVDQKEAIIPLIPAEIEEHETKQYSIRFHFTEGAADAFHSTTQEEVENLKRGYANALTYDGYLEFKYNGGLLLLNAFRITKIVIREQVSS
jgi:hypothetical protein